MRKVLIATGIVTGVLVLFRRLTRKEYFTPNLTNCYLYENEQNKRLQEETQ